MTWVATAIIGSAIVGGVASNMAASKQAKSANKAIKAQNELLGPWSQAGLDAIPGLQDFVNEGSNYANTQAYKDITNSAKASGMSLSGNRLTALTDYYANNFRPNRLAELLAIPTLGQASAANQAANVGNLLTQKGNAQAAGILGTGDVITSGIQKYGNYNFLQNYGTGGSSAPNLSGYTVPGSGGQTPQQFYSDIRLKKNIQQIGKLNGNNIYTWEWNDIAIERGVTDPTIGVIAQEVDPAFVTEKDGYLMVDYDGLFAEIH